LRLLINLNSYLIYHVKVIGKVAQIIGPVVDVVFNGKDVELPKIYDSLEITKKDGTLLVLEVQSHIGENTFVPFRWTQQMV
jgi:F0F1-type ATP synthase beta subunit